MKRRKFLSDSLKTVGGCSIIVMSLGAMTRQGHAQPTVKLRPPGAGAEDSFLGNCIRCGLCVRDCPYDTLELSVLGDGGVTGTPYFEARDIPCEMCEDIPCVVTCPTGALDPALKNIDDADMGTAVLISASTCLSVQGLRCEVCYRVCPLLDEAITLRTHINTRTRVHAIFVPTVNPEKCTGCGKCERACVLDTAAIKVLPQAIAMGSPDQHYRMGWEEKKKAGHSLVPQQRQIPIRRPVQGSGP